ncbi:MAG TPA: cytochrome C oxidase subunit I [Burkholderiales bacterium]|nr:cytochrome C oxidase subunit I [Burkholderiales bacterium]
MSILAICAAPTVAAWFAYFVWPPQSRANYGELIEARPLPSLELRRLDGSLFRFSQLRGKWLMLQIGPGACAEACRKNLFNMRQSRLAQGKDAERIERVWLLSDAAVPDAVLLGDYAGMHVVRAPGSPLMTEFPGMRDPGGHIYVIDPLGNLMLRFPGDPDARRMMKDLARLLRASRIG